MKKFKTIKRSIIVILTLCMLLNTIGICAYATAVPEDNMATSEDTTVVVEETVVATEEPIIVTEENIVVTEENTQELMPMMARGCGYGNLSSWSDIDHATKKSILADVSGNYQAVVGRNPNIYYDSNGTIYLCGTGSYSGSTYPTDLNKGWY